MIHRRLVYEVRMVIYPKKDTIQHPDKTHKESDHETISILAKNVGDTENKACIILREWEGGKYEGRKMKAAHVAANVGFYEVTEDNTEKD